MPTFLKARLLSWRVGFRYKIPARLRCKAIWHMTALVHKWMHVLTSQGSATPDHWLFGYMLQSLWLGISTILRTHHCWQSIQMECICLQQRRSATCCIIFCPVRPHCSMDNTHILLIVVNITSKLASPTQSQVLILERTQETVWKFAITPRNTNTQKSLP